MERFFVIANAYGFDPIELLKSHTTTGMTEADYDRLKQVVMVVMELLDGLEHTPQSKQIAAAVAEVMKVETLRCEEQPDTEFESGRYEGLAKLVFADG